MNFPSRIEVLLGILVLALSSAASPAICWAAPPSPVGVDPLTQLAQQRGVPRAFAALGLMREFKNDSNVWSTPNTKWKSQPEAALHCFSAGGHLPSRQSFQRLAEHLVNYQSGFPEYQGFSGKYWSNKWVVRGRDSLLSERPPLFEVHYFDARSGKMEQHFKEYAFFETLPTHSTLCVAPQDFERYGSNSTQSVSPSVPLTAEEILNLQVPETLQRLGPLYRVGNTVWTGVAKKKSFFTRRLWVQKMKQQEAMDYCKKLGGNLPNNDAFERLTEALTEGGRFHSEKIPEMEGLSFISLNSSPHTVTHSECHLQYPGLNVDQDYWVGTTGKIVSLAYPFPYSEAKGAVRCIWQIGGDSSPNFDNESMGSDESEADFSVPPTSDQAKIYWSDEL